jgi:hypothetical protein
MTMTMTMTINNTTTPLHYYTTLTIATSKKNIFLHIKPQRNVFTIEIMIHFIVYSEMFLLRFVSVSVIAIKTVESRTTHEI